MNFAALTRRVSALAVLALVALAGTIARAQTAEPAASAPDANAAQPSGLALALEQQVRALALGSSKGATPNATTPSNAPRVEVSVGQLDPRLRLAPCQHVDPYVPDGMRMWGKSRIGLRCTQGAVHWNVYLPIQVKVFGKGLVVANGLPGGAVISRADVAQVEVDVAEDPSPPLLNPDAVVGRTLARAIKPGESLRASHLKPRQWFAAGETVTIVAQGEGFVVSGEAEALNPGIEGVAVRVRTDSGRVLTGLPVAERRVELGL